MSPQNNINFSIDTMILTDTLGLASPLVDDYLVEQLGDFCDAKYKDEYVSDMQ